MAQMTVAGHSSQNSSQPIPSVTRPKIRMNSAANSTGTAMMTTSIRKAMQRRAIDQSNQLMALDARLRAEEAAAQLQRPAPRVPELRYKPAAGAGFTRALPPSYPAVPDAALADSNRRVQAAARNRR